MYFHEHLATMPKDIAIWQPCLELLQQSKKDLPFLEV